MSKLVLDLQRSSMDSRVRVSNLLRQALVVATKLDINEFKDWIKDELNGYDEEPIPKYRNVIGEIKANNPYQGLIPVIFEDSEVSEKLSNRNIGSSISELENCLSNNQRKSTLVVPLPPNIISKVSRSQGMIPYLVTSESQIVGILDTVRTIVLQWSLKLEKDGILGEELSFSPEEKSIASTITYNINKFSGIIGDVRADQLQIGDYNSIHSKLKESGISQTERNELENILDSLGSATNDEKSSLRSRGFDWLKRNAKYIGPLAKTIRGWFESVA